MWLAGSPHYSCFVVDVEGNILYLLSRGGSKAPGKNVKQILGWHDRIVYMAALRKCLEERRAVIFTYHLYGDRAICALVPLSRNKVLSHRLKVHGNYKEALRVLIRLAFGKSNG